jgi:glutamate racemase
MSEAGRSRESHWIVTDSGLGGISVCAAIEWNLRRSAHPRATRITYFNSWPDPQSGYNALAGIDARALVFNRALMSMAQLRPDRIIIACNTLSILYPLTDYSRAAAIPVTGIIEASVDYFCEALRADPNDTILLLGTRTTIDSRAHRDLMAEKGIGAERIAAVSCHGLAGAIEKNPDGPAVAELIEDCVAKACRTGLPDSPFYAGLCCTHYTYVRESIRVALERRTNRGVGILDPNGRLADLVAPPGPEVSEGAAQSRATVSVVSKVQLDERQRQIMAERAAQVSPITARALLSYNHVPDLF